MRNILETFILKFDMKFSRVYCVCIVFLCVLFEGIAYAKIVENSTIFSAITTDDEVHIQLTTSKDCDCGKDSNGCEIQNGAKICHCKNGYLQNLDGYCRECSCGSNGNCTFEKVEEFLRKHCDCPEGYAEFGGICRDCSCGKNGNCSLNRRGLKECSCEYGYGAVLGTCTPCGCAPWEGCSYDETTKRCQCIVGYEDVRGLCKDIDECLIPDVCPKTSKCTNTPGSYTCECRKRYEKPSGNFDPKKDFCHDIDECTAMPMPCLYESTTCVNTPGSYRCDCRSGFKPLVTPVDPRQPARYNDCIEDTSSSRTLAIVVGCICGFIIVLLLILVQCKERRRSRFQ